MYTFAPQRAKGWQTGVACTICQPLFCQLYCQSGGQEVGPTSPSPSQRYNTLDFASKVVCHETPARFLWILPAAMGAVAGALPRDCTALWGLILVGMLQLCYNKRKIQLIWGASAPRICREESCKTNPTKPEIGLSQKLHRKKSVISAHKLTVCYTLRK